MINIVLISPRLRNWSPNVWVPLGLCYVASVLEREGHNVEIVDLNVEKLNDKGLQKKVGNADIIGITGMITEYQEVLKLINIAKKANRYTKVIVGGPLATTLPQELLQVSKADFVVIGEGERTILSLVSAIRHGDGLADIKGIGYRDSNQIIITEPPEPITNLDTIPFPARHLLDMNRYLKNHFERFGFKIKELGKIKSTNLITSRGCPYSCTFCFKDMWGHKWRGRSPQNIVEEMEFLYQRYGVNGFFFNDDTFVLDRKRVFELCQLLKEKGLPIVWHCNGRANLMTKELLKAMYNAGCRGIAYGIESGNQQILDAMKKNITLDQVRNVVKWTKEAGINILGYFMFGTLGETKATIEETMAFAKELNLDYYGFAIVAPLLGTELYSSALEAGLIPKEKGFLSPWTIDVNANLTQDCSDDDLVNFQNKAFKELNLKKRFGRCYMFNPNFLREAAGVLLSSRSKEQVKELAIKGKRVIRSYYYEA